MRPPSGARSALLGGPSRTELPSTHPGRCTVQLSHISPQATGRTSTTRSTAPSWPIGTACGWCHLCTQASRDPSTRRPSEMPSLVVPSAAQRSSQFPSGQLS
eukprot:1394779-Prymnesium_polylepis.1